MEVILEKTISKLGLVGSVVSVADGYARNYLLPKGYAVKATKHNIQEVENRIKTIRAKELKEQEAAEQLSEKIADVTVNIEVKASEDGKLFGSVTSKEIYDALKNEGYDLDKKCIDLKDHIKFLGMYTVTLKLHAMVQTEIKVWVIRETSNEK